MSRAGLSLIVVAMVALGGTGAYAQTGECESVAGSDPLRQIRFVEANLHCSPYFVSRLVSDPRFHLKAFFSLVSSPAATDAIFLAVYEEHRRGRFRFPSAILDELTAELPRAAAACSGSFRCPDWDRYIVSDLLTGGMFACPPIEDLDLRRLLEIVPYAGYACAEAAASALSPRADAAAFAHLADLSRKQGAAWSRRNAMRLLGRLVEYRRTGGSSHETEDILLNTAKSAAIDRLKNESAAVVLHEAVWILDSLFFPAFEVQSQLENIVHKPAYDDSLRFRAMSAVVRLIQAKPPSLGGHDAGMIAAALQSDSMWVRAQAAFLCELLGGRLADTADRQFLIAALNSAWTKEDRFAARMYIGRALDLFENSQARVAALKLQYEQMHLPNAFEREAVSIRSSLPPADMIRLSERVARNTALFLQMMGPAFSTAVPNDANRTLRVAIFGSREVYREYASLFLGSGFEGGGIYLEETGTFYTYQAADSGSIFTLERAMDHEQAHYLQGRYIFPGSWKDRDYHAEPKGWADEGMAEFIVEGSLYPELERFLPAERLTRLCRSPKPDLSSLLSRREGYSEPGTFDYDSSWAFVRYLMTKRRATAANLFGSLRDGTYRLKDFAAISGAESVAEIESAWHAAIENWCAIAPAVR